MFYCPPLHIRLIIYFLNKMASFFNRNYMPSMILSSIFLELLLLFCTGVLLLLKALIEIRFLISRYFTAIDWLSRIFCNRGCFNLCFSTTNIFMYLYVDSNSLTALYVFSLISTIISNIFGLI